MADLVEQVACKHQAQGDTLHFATEQSAVKVNDPRLVTECAPEGILKVHCGCCAQVAVVVHYNDQTFSKDLLPATTVDTVKTLAAQEFHVSAADAAELVLKIFGVNQFAPPRAPIGTLADASECKLVLDLLPAQRPQGGANDPR